jgi:hypothetical protein
MAKDYQVHALAFYNPWLLTVVYPLMKFLGRDFIDSVWAFDINLFYDYRLTVQRGEKDVVFYRQLVHFIHVLVVGISPLLICKIFMENRDVFLTWVPVVFCLVQIPEIRLLETVVDLFVVPGLFTGNYRPSIILNKIKNTWLCKGGQSNKKSMCAAALTSGWYHL